MKLTRKQLRRLINEQVFGIRQMSQSPVLRALGVNSPSERKKVNACKQAANIITNLGLPKNKLFKILNVAVSITYNYFKAEKENKNIRRAFNYFNTSNPLGVGYISANDGDEYAKWLSTKGRSLNPSGGHNRNPTEGSFGYRIPNEMFDLIPLLHEISKASISKPGFFSALRGFKQKPPVRPEIEDYQHSEMIGGRIYSSPEEEQAAYDSAYQRYSQERQENLSNLEKSASITIQGKETVLGLFGGRLNKKDLGMLITFIDGISKCSSENGGIEISF